MKRRCTSGGTSRRASGGFAIVLTLLVITMLTVLVIGFNAATRTEQMAARNFSYQESAGQMASLSVNRAIALLNTNVTNGTITQPGRSWSPSAKDVILTSASAGPSTSSTNINAFQGSNYFIATNTNPVFFTVPLVDVTVSNVLVGRYGFWIDDDSSRMNLNAALPTNRANFLPTNSRPLVFANNTISPLVDAGVRASFAALLTNANRSDVGWGYFFTPRHLARVGNVGAATYNALMYQVGAGPLNRPANSYVLAPANTPAFLDAGGADGFLSVYGSPNYSNNLPSLLSALDKVATNYFSGSNYARYFGAAAAGGLAGKYQLNLMRQIVANINDYSQPTGTLASPGPVAVTGANDATSMLSAELIPRVVAGYRPFPFLNEIASRSFFYHKPGDPQLNVQVWLTFEIANPYRTDWGDASEVVVRIQDWNFEGSYSEGTNVVAIPRTTASVAGSDFSARWAAGVNLRSKSYTNLVVGLNWNVPIAINASNIQITNRIDLATVRYLQWPSDPTTIRDWAQGDDLPVWEDAAVPLAASNSRFLGAVETKDVPSYVSWTNSGAIYGVAKNDPRVRRYADWSPPSAPWLPVGKGGSLVTIGSNNSTVNFSGTGFSGAPKSDNIAVANIMQPGLFDADSLALTYPSRPWFSAFDYLARIHTGLQWRTLQLRAQDSAEAGRTPDWAVLEVFAISNNSAPVAVKINMNSLPYPAVTGSSAAAMLAQGLTRAPVISSLLAGNTNNATSASVGTNTLGIPASAQFPTTGAGSFGAVATNIASLAFTNTWATRRTVTNVYPTNAYSMVSEVLEISNVSNFSSDEAANEGRARGFYDALTVSSDAFTIYAVGYAMDRNTNVIAESRMRVQVARDPGTTNRFRIILAEPLVWP